MSKIQRAQYVGISVLFAIGLVWFGLRWFDFRNVLPDNFLWSRGSDLFDLLLFAVLSVTIFFPFWMAALCWIVAGQISTGDRPPSATGRPLRVAMITTYVPGAEPLEMLESTLRAMIAARDLPGWKHDTWVLDEGDDEAVRALAKRVGALYFTRHGVESLNTMGGQFSARTKGGNHNAWYFEVGFEWYDIVSQWDTDFTVVPHVLERILPYFSDERVAWVGSPQVYDNLDNFIARGAAEQTYQFYGPFNRGLSSRRHSLMLGANHTVRVAALAEIGGYDAHLVEDLATGMTLHSRGWQSRYIHEVLALGEGPTSWTAYFKQQFRWAKGCVDLLLTSSFRRAMRMPKGMAVLYLWMQQFYLGGLVFGAAMILLTLNFGFGWKSTNIQFGIFVQGYVPLLLLAEGMVFWLQQFNCRPKKERGFALAGRVLGTMVMPVFCFAVIAAVRDRGRHTVFEVTPKGGSKGAVLITVKPARGTRGKNPFMPQIVTTSVGGSGLLVGIVLHHLDFVNVFWALTVTGSGVALAASMHGPRWSRGTRAAVLRVFAGFALALEGRTTRLGVLAERNSALQLYSLESEEAFGTLRSGVTALRPERPRRDDDASSWPIAS